jgi:hypothetical protein
MEEASFFSSILPSRDLHTVENHEDAVGGLRTRIVSYDVPLTGVLRTTKLTFLLHFWLSHLS